MNDWPLGMGLQHLTARIWESKELKQGCERGLLNKWIIITCSKTFNSAYKMYSHGLSPLHFPKSLLKRQVLLCVACKGQRWDGSVFLQYLSNKAAACGGVCQMDSVSLAVVIVVSNKPVHRLEWHQLRAEIINVTSSLLCTCGQSGGHWMGSKLPNDCYVNNKHFIRTYFLLGTFPIIPFSCTFFSTFYKRGNGRFSATGWLLWDPTAMQA